MKKYYFQYLSLFIGMGAYSTFLPVYLENSLNFSPSQIGVILSLPSILGILFVPICGIISDVSNKKKTVLFVNLLMCFIISCIYTITKSFWSVFIICSLFELFRSPVLPLTDSLTTSYCKKSNKNYGSIRVIGSLAFALSSFFCGLITNMTNNNLMFFYFLIISSLCCTIIIPSLPIYCNKSQKVSLTRDLHLLFKNKKYVLILICGVCISSMTEAMISYQGIHLMNLGATTKEVGLLIVFMVFPELIFMVKSKSLLDKLGLVKMLCIANILLLIRWIIYYFTTTPLTFMICTCAHGIVTSIITICAFDFIGNVVSDKLHTTAMTVYTFTVGISYSLLKLLYGTMIDIFGMKSIFAFSIIVSIATFIVLGVLKNVLYENRVKSAKMT